MECLSYNFASRWRLCCLAFFAIWIQIVYLLPMWQGTYEKHIQKCDDSACATQVGEAKSQNTCTVYMAPSSINGVESMGIYTTKDLRKDSPIVNGIDGLSIPVIDFDTNREDDTKQMRKDRKNWMKEFDEYWWGRGRADQMMWEADLVLDLKMTFGQLPNHHCVLPSLNVRNPEKKAYNDVMVNRTDPGAGAFSYHRGRQFTVHRDVEAGEEIFLFYGHCKEWEEGDPEWTKYVVKTLDYETAARMAQKTWKNVTKVIDSWNRKGRQEDALDDMVSDDHDALYMLNKKAASVFPRTFDQLNNVMTKLQYSPSIRQVAKQLAMDIGTTPRNVNWIRQHGLCVDNIVSGPSKLAHAGQGAFAQRVIPKGKVVVPSPTLHIPDRDLLLVSNPESSQSSMQLLINYCWGHSKSSLLLCPITNTMLINHCSTRKRECGKDGPNAEYRWASGWDTKTEKWLQKPLEDIAKESERALSMEIVAIRDINEGEEIFMDYGIEWEEAWEKHVTKWEPKLDGHYEPRISPTELNEKNGPLELLVSEDLRKTVEHPNLFTGCIFRETDFDQDVSRWATNDDNWEKLDDSTILGRYSTDDGRRFVGEYADQFDGAYWPCSVIHSDDGGSTYTVRIFESQFSPFEPAWQTNGLPRFITKFPRSSIRYFAKPYTSAQHMPGAFRHHIGIRDDMFPEQWKNRH